MHLLNVNYSTAEDAIVSQHDVEITLTSEIDVNGTGAALYSFDAEPFLISVRRSGNTLTFLVPELRVWAIVSIGDTE